MIENIEIDSSLTAIIIRAGYKKDGIEFFTPNEFSQQLAYMNRPAGYVIAPHIHNDLQRQVLITQEVLFIRSGRLKIDFYDDNRNYRDTRILETGDVIFLASGGHGFEMLEPTEIIEVKQGPYSGEMDKIRFEPKTSPSGEHP